MKYQLWRIRVFFIFLFVVKMPFKFAWDVSGSIDSYFDDYTPSEAVKEELTYWGSDE